MTKIAALLQVRREDPGAFAEVDVATEASCPIQSCSSEEGDCAKTYDGNTASSWRTSKQVGAWLMFDF